MKSISSRSEESKVVITIRARKLMKRSPSKADLSDDDAEESVDERALICNIFFSSHPQYH